MHRLHGTDSGAAPFGGSVHRAHGRSRVNAALSGATYALVSAHHDDPVVTTRVRALDEAAEIGRRLTGNACGELRAARLDRNLSTVDIGRALRWSHSKASRIERGRMPNVAVSDLAQFAGAVGLQLGLRMYPGGEALRDAGQTRLLERFRRHLHSGTRFRFKVPLPMPGDPRAWDMLLRGNVWRCGVEAETGPRDGQALNRRLELKRRDGEVDHVLLILPNTRRVRAFLGETGALLRTNLPGDQKVVLARLASGEDPGTSAILVL